MTSFSLLQTRINICFFRNASALYGERGITPATQESAGADLRACPETHEPLIIAPGERRSIPTGIAIEPLTPGIAGFVYSRSGLGAVKGLTVAQGVGVIDPDYRGEILVFLLNTSAISHTVLPGERIAQLVFQPFARPLFHYVSDLGESGRGKGGFGHTGVC